MKTGNGKIASLLADPRPISSPPGEKAHPFSDRQAHNLKVVGSNPTPATNTKARNANALAGFFARQFV